MRIAETLPANPDRYSISAGKAMGTEMLPIDIIVPQTGARLWQKILVDRLAADGYDLAVLRQKSASGWPFSVNAALAFERKLFRRNAPGLASPLAEIAEKPRNRPAALRLDLTGLAKPSDIPTLTLTFDGSPFDLSAAVAVAAGGLPVIEAVFDGQTIAGRARPMIDKRESTALGIDDVFARAITLAASTIQAFAQGRPAGQERTGTEAKGKTTGFLPAYLGKALPRLGREAFRRVRYHQAHWRVGYRFTDGPGVADTGELGTGWSILPDACDRFYADPFVFEREGRSFIFVEDYVHAVGKAVISVIAFDENGFPGTPRIVLEEPHHLSYPQVFERDGAIWMLPEASASGKLTLYRAAEFPDRWVPEAVLLEGEISDATLLDHGGSLWLFATQRDGHGSTSDTLVIFSAPSLAGPWRPHPLNPVTIDHRTARPGGAFVRGSDGRIFLPVQDGTQGYGGGLGISEVLVLDERTVKLSAPRPVETAGDWPYPQVHTLNRSSRLEVIDGIAAVRKTSGR